MFPDSTTLPTYRRLSDDVRSRILEGELTPGERLDSEERLSARYGIGRSSVREALRTLASEGLVVTTRGVTGGTFVSDPSTELATAGLATSLHFLTGTNALSVAELLEAREFLEVPAAALAAERGDPALAERLRTCIPESRENDSAPFVSNRAFHTVVMEATGNRLLEVMARPVFEVLRTRYQRQGLPTGFWDDIDAEHMEIHAAIAAGDGIASARLMKAHLRTLRRTYEGIEES